MMYPLQLARQDNLTEFACKISDKLFDLTLLPLGLTSQYHSRRSCRCLPRLLSLSLRHRSLQLRIKYLQPLLLQPLTQALKLISLIYKPTLFSACQHHRLPPLPIPACIRYGHQHSLSRIFFIFVNQWGANQ